MAAPRVLCAVVIVIATVAIHAAHAEPLGIEPLSAHRQTELVTLVRQDCGSCHGMTLQGGLGSPLLPEALQGKPAEYLEYVITNGISGTPMPPWKRFLNATEVQWIAANLKKGFPHAH
jgi:cytochrome c55X